MGDPRVAAPAPPLGVFDELSKLLSFARETLSDFLGLVALEVRGAGLALVWMIVGALFATVLTIAAWAGLMAALAMYLVSLGVLPVAAVLGVAVVNLIAAAALLYWCVRLSRHLLFAATRRQVAGVSHAKQPAPTPSAPESSAPTPKPSAP